MHDRCHNRHAFRDEFACTGGWSVVGPVFQLDDIWRTRHGGIRVAGWAAR